MEGDAHCTTRSPWAGLIEGTSWLQQADAGEARPWTAPLAGAGGLEGLSTTRAQQPGQWSRALLLPFSGRDTSGHLTSGP